MDLPQRSSLSATIRLFAIWVIVLLPFQNLPKTLALKWYGKGNTWTQLALWADEGLALFLIIMLISWYFLKKSNNQLCGFSVPKSLLLFISVNVVCITINNIDIYRGALAVFDYSKNISIAILFYLLAYRLCEFKKALILFINIGLLVAILGLIGEVLVLFTDSVVDVLVMGSERFGFHRVTSVAGVGAGNYVGVYIVLVFWLLFALRDEFTHVKIKFCLLIIFISFTGSRQTWLSFFLLFFLVAGKRKIFFSIIAALIVISLGYSMDVLTSFKEDELIGGLDYRSATYSMCINYIKTNPFWGVGPGMVGGLAVQILWSPLYSDWPPDVMWFLVRMRGEVDQFWGRLFADVGMIGGVAYLLIYLALGRDLLLGSRFFIKIGNRELQRVGEVLFYYILVLGVMGTASGINSALITYPFFAFSGMYLSLYKNHHY